MASPTPQDTSMEQVDHDEDAESFETAVEEMDEDNDASGAGEDSADEAARPETVGVQEVAADAVEAVVEEAEDDDNEEVLAAVVVEDNGDNGGADDEVEAAVVVETPSPKKETPQKRTTTPKKKTPTSAGSKKKKKTSRPGHAGSDNGVSPQRREASSDARAMLQDTVPTLPIPVGETQVRSFGRLYIEPENVKVTRFSTPSALYPVGFSCDRYEFSPVHGRVLRMRCSILDGRKIKQKQKAGGHPVSQIHDGPVFRVMWGQGVDEDSDEVEYPFDPQVNAAPLTSSKSSAASLMDGSHVATILPEVGMRVRVRFSKDRTFCGTISSVTEKDSKKKRKHSKIEIQYDDGSSESIVYPDPDISLMMPGAEDEIDSQGNMELTELNGKPIISVVGTTPLETWGKSLVKLGLIDEIMLASATEAVENTREEGLREAKDKLEGKVKPKPRSEKGDDAVESGAPSPVPGAVNDEDGVTQVEAEQEPASDKEQPTLREIELRKQVESLTAELESAQEEDRQASVALANSRINALGRFLCNPFHDEASGKSQQASWLATAVRKEKTRMGSTGNRKKVVSATDLLERNDSFYNTDIEALIEGLPGSEFCKSYVFQAFRAGGGGATLNRAWIHEAQLRHEKETARRQKRSREAQEKEAAKAHEEQEREKKRRKKEQFRDARKRQKMEEEEEKKKVRVEERLSRLRVQVDDRLSKEACAQREKVVTVLARNLAKEFARRRRAAELVSGFAVIEAKASRKRSTLMPYDVDLTVLSKPYDEDAIRVWNFVSTFSSFFLQRGYMTEIPSLDSLQAAIDVLKQRNTNGSITVEEAITSLTDLAVALCKPLAATLTRVMFASLIALNPVLQKDFGAAFFNEVNANTKEDDADGSRPDVLFPVNSMTWQEVARISLLADALGELGYQRHEAAHFLRGYRSAGHPNSKEARRLRRAEEFSVALLRQTITSSRLEVRKRTSEGSVTRADVPCTPLCYPHDLCFFLHNLKSIDDLPPSKLKKYLNDAVTHLRESDEKELGTQLRKMERLQSLLEDLGSSDQLSKAESRALKKAKDELMQIFNEIAGPASDKFTEDAAKGIMEGKWPWTKEEREIIPEREQMGLLNYLVMTADDYKTSSHARENYMEDALRLKEELKREKGEDEDNDDEDEEDDDENGVSSAVVVESGSVPVDTEDTKAREAPSNDSAQPTTVPSSENNDSKQPKELGKIGKETPYDEFCEDIPTAPELIRRCLAVLRTLCLTGCAEPFLYPVDPQTNPAYYDSLVRPMCLRQVGIQLRQAASRVTDDQQVSKEETEEAVAQFGRSIRLIGQNCLSYANAGPTVISAGAELLRIFERLLLDWVLAPGSLLPPLDALDDDRCVEHHPSDTESTVLLCDGCEGKYNIARLVPPLHDIPKGDWYCPRCVQGSWWGDLDPRIGKRVIDNVCSEEGVESKGPEATVKKCILHYPESAGSKPSLMYLVEFEDGEKETWPLAKVDQALALAGNAVAPIRCLEAVAENIGYGFGVDHGLRHDLVPVPVNPNVSDGAAQGALSSSVFRDTIAAAGTLLVIDPRDMTASEWLRLLTLLVMKCSSSEVVQSIISTMENEAAEKMKAPLEKLGNVSSITDALPPIHDDTPLDNGNMESTEAMELSTPNKKQDTPASSESVAAPTGVVPEASAVEVVDEMDVDDVPENAITSAEVTAKPETEDQEETDHFATVLAEKKRRQKLSEDSFAAYNIKNQIRSTVASFEEDTVSQVVDSTLSSKNSPLDFSSLRCRRMVCDFCGLTDIALGLPLVRVPNEDEWGRLIPHAARSRRTHLVAEIPSKTLELGSQTRLVSVTLVLDDEIVSVPCDSGGGIDDGGMVEFTPRSETGFQDELRFRDEVNLPFVTGSLSAHECCAISAHNSRKEKMVQLYRERTADTLEKEFGMECGRTLEIGEDAMGRSFWKFHKDPDALFICSEPSSGVTPKWLRFSDPEAIASVMVSLGKDDLVRDLQRAYPSAFKMVRDGTWTDALLKRKFPKVADIMAGKEKAASPDEELALTVEGGFEVYHVGENVLVESKSGRLVWDATVTAHSTRPSTYGNGSLIIDAYRVEYTGWSSRFTEWVQPSRVVEPNEHNRLMQEEMIEEHALSRYGLPTELNQLVAKDFLYARDRARGKEPLPDFARVAHVDWNKPTNAKTLGLMKAALFAIEAALPVGSIDNRDSGPWRKPFAEQWKAMVKKAEGPELLIRCTILLEDTISVDWIKEDIGHLRSCLPARWKAIGEATASALALRVILLDRSIMYETIDRRKYSSRKKKRST